MDYLTLVSLLSFVLLFHAANGLRCWTCQNAHGTRECMRTGSLKTCDVNEQMCFSELRNINGYFYVTKRCKEALACVNNNIQNPRDASINAQCNPFRKSSVCRCCCGTSGCNQRGLFCVAQEPECPYIPKPFNGFVRCKFKKSAKEVGSVCSWSCKLGFRLTGPPSAKCTKVPVGPPQFTPKTARCVSYTCPPAPTHLEHGRVSCNMGNAITSSCKFTCNKGFTLIGADVTRCAVDGNWYPNPPPICQPPQICDALTAPLDGIIMCDKDGIALGTNCLFACNDGYFLHGADELTCIKNEETNVVEWNNPRPYCEQIVCLPEQSPPDGGAVDCTTNVLGTLCTFTCDEGYVMYGNSTSECVPHFGPLGQWTNLAPLCMENLFDEPGDLIISIECPELEPLEDGDIICSKGNNMMSECYFFCNEGHHVHGNAMIKCQTDLTWSGKPPTCDGINCGDQIIPIGEAHCSDSHNVGSVCTFSCDVGSDRVLFPSNITENSCKMAPDGSHADWWPSPPCCGLPCPPYMLMDLVVVLDSSSSVKQAGWDLQMNFTRQLINEFYLGADSARMSLFRFNSEVDTKTEIRLIDTADGSMANLMLKVDLIKYEGRGTRTGDALRHVRTKSLTAGYGNRPDVDDVVLVVTDGLATDPRVMKAEAKLLLEAGVEIWGVGIGLDRYASKRLQRMTGNKDRTVNVQDFENLLDEAFIKALGKGFCDDPCRPPKLDHDHSEFYEGGHGHGHGHGHGDDDDDDDDDDHDDEDDDDDDGHGHGDDDDDDDDEDEDGHGHGDDDDDHEAEEADHDDDHGDDDDDDEDHHDEDDDDEDEDHHDEDDDEDEDHHDEDDDDDDEEDHHDEDDDEDEDHHDEDDDDDDEEDHHDEDDDDEDDHDEDEDDEDDHDEEEDDEDHGDEEESDEKDDDDDDHGHGH